MKNPPQNNGPIATTEEIVEEARNGRMVILVDDEDRENAGDLVIPAQFATPEKINFMATHGHGLICLSLTRRRVEELGLTQMSRANGTRHETAFTVSIEAKEGVTTGISAADRARTIDAAKGKAAVDVARLAGLNPSGVICEIMKDDGSMARLADLGVEKMELLTTLHRHIVGLAGFGLEVVGERRLSDELSPKIELPSEEP